MPEVQMYDESGHLTLDGMKAEHAAGRSVLWPNAGGRNVLIRPGEQLPSEAEMAKGKPAQEEAVRQALQAQIAELQSQMNSLGKSPQVTYAASNEQVTGNLPGQTVIHPDMVGAYPPQRGDGAKPLDAAEISPEHRVTVIPEGPATLPAEAPPSEEREVTEPGTTPEEEPPPTTTPPSGGGYDAETRGKARKGTQP